MKIRSVGKVKAYPSKREVKSTWSKLKTGKFEIMPDSSSSNIPYSDDVVFYANPNSKEVMWVKAEYMGKGWYNIFVNGMPLKKTRYAYDYEVPFGFKKVSLFSETSYHSKLDAKRKITRYGSHDYNLQYSDYEAGDEYKLLGSVKTNQKSKFGQVIDKVKFQKWNAMALNWKPVGNTKVLFITHTEHTPYDEKPVYISKEYPLSDKKKAIADFRSYVSNYEKRKGTR